MGRGQKLTCRMFLNGEEITELPSDVRAKYRERMSATLSRYFSANPDVYEKFLAGLEARGEKIRWLE